MHLNNHKITQAFFYLSILEEWATTNHNTIFLWDLKLEKIKAKISQINSTAINCIEEMCHLRCFAVSYTMKDLHKWLIVYRNDGLKVGSKLKLGLSGAQKIYYHKFTQTLLLVGNNTLPVYQIDPQSYDLSLLADMEGHQSVITSVTDLGDEFIVSGDDRGVLRIWNLSNLRCHQVLKIASALIELSNF